MVTRTPPLYVTGTWRVKEPFVVELSTIYVCKAVRSIDDLEARNVDVYKSFYEPHGIDYTTYENDVVNLASIVTLMSSTASTLYIPDTYIESYPNTTTMPYSHVVLSASLGSVPDTLNFDDVRQKIQALLLTSLGINADVNVHVSGVLAEGVDMVTHQSLENQRLRRIENNQSLYSEIANKENLIQELRAKVEGLEEILIDRGIVQ